MIGCTFTDNYTTESNAFYGGAIGINGGSEVRLINCSFSGNKYGTTAGTNDIGVFFKPANYTIAGCTGATIASRSDVGDITTNASGTATLDYSDLSKISFTYKVPITVTWNKDDITGSGGYSFTKGGVTITLSRREIDFNDKNFRGGGTFTTTLGNFTKIEVSARSVRTTGTGWSRSGNKCTWTGNASSVSFDGDINGRGDDMQFVFTIDPKN